MNSGGGKYFFESSPPTSLTSSQGQSRQCTSILEPPRRLLTIKLTSWCMNGRHARINVPFVSSPSDTVPGVIVLQPSSPTRVLYACTYAATTCAWLGNSNVQTTRNPQVRNNLFLGSPSPTKIKGVSRGVNHMLQTTVSLWDIHTLRDRRPTPPDVAPPAPSRTLTLASWGALAFSSFRLLSVVVERIPVVVAVVLSYCFSPRFCCYVPMRMLVEWTTGLGLASLSLSHQSPPEDQPFGKLQ